jgi:hypothetical protein
MKRIINVESEVIERELNAAEAAKVSSEGKLGLTTDDLRALGL